MLVKKWQKNLPQMAKLVPQMGKSQGYPVENQGF